jgi:hypothetical protein
MSNLVCKKASTNPEYCYSLLTYIQELIDRISKQYQPIAPFMADSTRPGWELLLEDGEPATGDNWAERLAANDSITMNLELRWKSLPLLPPPPAASVHQGAGYGPYAPTPTPGYSGATVTPSGYTGYGPYAPTPSGYASRPFSTGPYPQQFYQPYLATYYPAPAPPSTVSDIAHPARSTQEKLLESKKAELEELKEKTVKLRVELSIRDLAETRAKEAAEASRIEEEEKKRAAKLRPQELKELKPIEFTDCMDRYFKFPYISCLTWPVCTLNSLLPN